MNVKVSPIAEFNSIAPPALFAVLSSKLTLSTTKVPGVRLKIPPPEPAVPLATFRTTCVPGARISVPPLLKTPPPPLSEAFPAAVLKSIKVSPKITSPA